MNISKKIIALALTGALALGAFTGCAKKASIESTSTQGFIMKTLSATGEDSEIVLMSQDGSTLSSWVVPCSFSAAVISADGLEVGDTCVLTIGDTSEEITIDNSAPVTTDFGAQGGNLGDMNRDDFSGEMPSGEAGQMPEPEQGFSGRGQEPMAGDSDITNPSEQGAEVPASDMTQDSNMMQGSNMAQDTNMTQDTDMTQDNVLPVIIVLASCGLLGIGLLIALRKKY